MKLLVETAARGGTGILALAILLGAGYIGGWPFFALIAIMAVIALTEFYSALQAAGYRPAVLAGWTCTILILLATEYGVRWGLFAPVSPDSGASGIPFPHGGATIDAIILSLLVLCAVVSLFAAARSRGDQSSVVNAATTVFGVVYLGLLLSFALRLNRIDVVSLCTGAGEPAGPFVRRAGALTLAILPTWVSDSAAFLAGNLWGRRKLAPRISPNKTLVGSAGGLLTETGAVVLLGLWFHLPVVHAILLGLVMGVVGQLGDLTSSMVKRELDVDDFGAICGPHGGLLDRFDAVLPTFLVVYWYFHLIWLASMV